MEPSQAGTIVHEYVTNWLYIWCILFYVEYCLFWLFKKEKKMCELLCICIFNFVTTTQKSYFYYIIIFIFIFILFIYIYIFFFLQK